MKTPEGRNPRPGGPGERADYVEALGNSKGFQPYAQFPHDAAAYISGDLDRPSFDERVRSAAERTRAGSASEPTDEFGWKFDL